MKKILILLLAILPLKGLAQGIKFEQGTIAESLARAAREDKLIFVDVYTDWCGPCKSMSAGTFMDERVGYLFNRNFINLKVNAEKGEGVEFAQRYEVSAYPTLLFLNGHGEVVHRILGARKADELIAEAELLTKAGAYGGIETMKKRFADGDTDPDFLLAFHGLFPESDTKSRGAIGLRYLLSAPDEVLFNVDDTDTILLVGGMMKEMPVFDRALGDRLIEGWKKLFGRNGHPRTITGDYSLGVMFPYQVRLGRLMDQAIRNGDREVMQAMVEFRETIPSDKNGPQGIGHTTDRIYSVTSGRGIFFADGDHQRLTFMAANDEDPAVFNPMMESYMETLIAEIPADSLDRRHAAKMAHYADIPQMMQYASYNLYTEADLGANHLVSWIEYYWYSSPDNKTTRRNVARWIDYAVRLNRLYPEAVIRTTPLMLKIGRKKEAIAQIELVRDGFSHISDNYPRQRAELDKLLVRVIENKAY